MSKDPFLKAMEELLEDQIDSINLKKISPAYVVTGKRTDEIMKTLESLPEAVETKTGSVKVHKLLAELEDLHNDLLGIYFDIAVKRGFSLAFKLIFYHLTMN